MILGLLDVSWLIVGPVTRLLCGLTVRYVLAQPRASEVSEWVPFSHFPDEEDSWD